MTDVTDSGILTTGSDLLVTGGREGYFQALDARTVHPLLPPSAVDDRGHLRTAPDRHGLEGFFGAVFEKGRAL